MPAAPCPARVQRRCQLVAAKHSQGTLLRPQCLHHGGGGRSNIPQDTQSGRFMNPREAFLRSCRSACRGANIDDTSGQQHLRLQQATRCGHHQSCCQTDSNKSTDWMMRGTISLCTKLLSFCSGSGSGGRGGSHCGVQDAGSGAKGGSPCGAQDAGGGAKGRSPCGAQDAGGGAKGGSPCGARDGGKGQRLPRLHEHLAKVHLPTALEQGLH